MWGGNKDRKQSEVEQHMIKKRAASLAMEELIKKNLNSQTLTFTGEVGVGGCISDGRSYQTDSGKVFIKHNTKPETKLMFEGEFASLEALYNTHTVRVPKPIKVFSDESGNRWFFAMEHIEMTSRSKYQQILGEQLARLHLHNINMKKSGKSVGESSSEYIDKFGFFCPTSCGLFSMPNDWENSWTDFYTTKRLEPQMTLLEERRGGDKEARRLLEILKPKIPGMFEGVEVVPSLLHGDLWSGNISETVDAPVIYDPASFYGHHEFDLAIAGAFGGFDEYFYSAYHRLIPKAPGFSTRHKLYMLFHYINHWNHFGRGYRSRSMALLEELSNFSVPCK